MYFVWITGLRGPSPQLWANEQYDSTTGKSKPTLLKIKLSESDQLLSLDRLAEKYPLTSEIAGTKS